MSEFPELLPALHALDTTQGNTRAVVSNLAVALAATGKRTDLRLADQHLRDIRQRFKGKRKHCHEDRAWLEWLTTVLRRELGTMKLHRVREYLTQARGTFLDLGLVYESVAVSADLARIVFPDRRRIWEVFHSHQIETFADRLSPRLLATLDRLERTLNARGWNVFDTIKANVEDVREACGPQMLACLLSWPDLRHPSPPMAPPVASPMAPPVASCLPVLALSEGSS